MSDDQFYGRPISKGFTSIEINLCEVCQRKAPNWLESKFEDTTPVVRFTCEDCHNEALEKTGGLSPDFYARELQTEEDLPEPSRPAWVDDIIQEQQGKGGIETIASPGTIEAKDFDFSSAPQTFTEVEDVEEEVGIVEDRQVASWAAKFIQEALFGPNPQEWLETQGAFAEDEIDITVKTLASFADHDMPSVKISAVQCLGTLSNKFSSKKDDIKRVLAVYVDDSDVTVSEFAQQTHDQIT